MSKTVRANQTYLFRSVETFDRRPYVMQVGAVTVGAARGLPQHAKIGMRGVNDC